MGTTRAWLGALGAGTSLAVASSIMLLVVSSVIAFNGWPDDLSGASAPEMAALSQASSAASQATPAVVALPQPVTRRTPSAATPDRLRDTNRSSRSDVPSPVAVGGDEDVAVGGDDQAAVVGDEPGAPSPAPDGSSDVTAEVDPVREVGDALRETTDVLRQTTSTAADVVAPVAPSVGGALQSVGAAGADTVDGVVESVLQP